MKNVYWAIITIVIVLCGCATPQTKTSGNPVYGATTDMAVAKGEGLDSAITTNNNVNFDVGSGVVRTNPFNELDQIAQRMIQNQPRPQGASIDFGFKWGASNEDAFGIGCRKQNTTENYRRWKLAPQFAIIPDLQLLKNPANKPGQAQLRAFGLSIQVALQYVY